MTTYRTPTAATAAPLDIPERHPSYRDSELNKAMKALRASVRGNPDARRCLLAAENRLRFVLRVIEQWDATHARRAEQLIALGNLPAASTAGAMIFDRQLRCSIYDRTTVPLTAQEDAERLAALVELDREVLE